MSAASSITVSVWAACNPLRLERCCEAIAITSDNGREFAGHQQIGQSLKADFYFAHPYHSWERGLNENTNGLVRQYFPKKSEFSKITDRQITKVVDRLNNRPRKTLGYKT